MLAEKAITSSTYNIYLLLLDMSKAFDTVCRNNLLKGHCIEFKYYADGIHSGLIPPG